MKCHFLILFSLFSQPLCAQESKTESNKSLRAAIQKWVAVMKETQTVQKDWREQKQVLLDSRDSLTSELVQVEREIAEADERRKTLDQASEDKLARKAKFDAGREAFRASLDALDAKVSAVIPILPAELAKNGKLEKAIADHQKFVATKDKDTLGLNSRLTAMLTILTEAEKFNQIVSTFDGKTVQAGEQRVLLDGAYFGLASGFAANEAGTSAFKLTPSANGWSEEEITDAAVIAEVRELIDVANGSGETRLVTLPLEIAR